MKTVIFKTCETLFEATLIKHKLENEHIDCFIANENFATTMPHFYQILGSGVQVLIYEKDFEHATALFVNNTENKQTSCPNCGSSNGVFGFGRKKTTKWIGIILSFIAGVPFNNLSNKFYCNDCKSEY